ncbi:MAG TPA: MDR family MFS transporter [Kofleriaceae bacterium]|nr:MDR family MFS transporter [Kofleriaceae bacterium]
MSAEAQALPMGQKVATMIGALLGLLLAALDQTIVSTAGPFIQKDLAIEPGIYVWITTSYLVASTVLVPIYGKLSDLYGRRRILLIAIGIFLAGSLACGFSQSASQLIAFRAIQGIGSAGLFTSAFAVVADLFPPAERGKWQGMFGAAWGVSSVIGPLLGGVLTQHLSWHWTFFVNMPIGAVAVGLIVSRMPALRRDHDVAPRLDIAGAVALAFATVPLLLALSLGHAEGTLANGWPWASWQIAALFGTSFAAAIGFVLIERRATSPILDLALFRIKPFAVGSLATFVVGSAFLGAIVFLPLFMVNVVGLSATSSGLTTTPLTFGIVAANITSGQLVSRLGSYKGLLIGSLVVLVGSFTLLALTLTTAESQASVSLKMVILGIGLGPSIPLFTLAIQTSVPMQQIGVATAAATFFRQMGTTIGIAILGTIFATSFAGELKRDMPAANEMPPQMRAMMERGGKGGGEADARVAFNAREITAKADANIDASPMPASGKAIAKQRAHEAIGRVDHAFKQAFTSSLVNVFWISLVIALIGLVITVIMPAVPLRGRGGGGGPRPAAMD